jgi:hypothetical protein
VRCCPKSGRQVFLHEAFAERQREVALVDRDRFAVQVAQPLDLVDRLAEADLKPPRHDLAGGHAPRAEHLRKGLVARRPHGLAEALQARQVLERLGLGDEAALAGDLEDQALLLQVAHGLADRDAADREGLHHLALGRHLGVRRVGAVEHAPANDFADLRVHRDGRHRHDARVGARGLP